MVVVMGLVVVVLNAGGRESGGCVEGAGGTDRGGGCGDGACGIEIEKGFAE